MVRLVTYSGEGNREACNKLSSEHNSTSDWRESLKPSKLIVVPGANSDSLIRNNRSDEPSRLINRDGSFFRVDRLKTFQDSVSQRSLKSVHRTISEYWRDVLRYHWPIAIQSLFLVIVIITMGPWVGFTCNEDISGSSEDRSVMWPFPIISNLRTAFDYSQTDVPQPACPRGYCCFSQNIEGSPTRRRASILKRKRITKAFNIF